MSKKVFNDVKAALEEAIAFSHGRDTGAVAHIPPDLDVQAIRKKTNCTQEQFAARFGFGVARLRDWEQGRTHPDAAMRAYLMVIDRKPEAVNEVLNARGKGKVAGTDSAARGSRREHERPRAGKPAHQRNRARLSRSVDTVHKMH